MRITQRQIAEIVGVSNVTVSHVLHKPHNARISLEKQQEIIRVAQQMGYQPRSVTTHTIGFVIESGEIHLDATENEIVFAHEILKEHGYRMLFVMMDQERPESLREVLNQKTVDGVLFNCWCNGKVKNLLPDEVPWVLLSEDEGVGDDVDQVSTDTVKVAMNTTRHLIECGHRRICLVAGSAGIGYHERLKRGMAQAMKAAGLPANHASVIEVYRNDEIGASLVKLMTGVNPPSAIMAASAGKAAVVLNRLLYAGYCVPRDVSLVSFGDSHRLTPLSPSISANTVFDRDVIAHSVERLILRIKSPATPPEKVLLTGQYIERESVAVQAISEDKGLMHNLRLQS